jgi:hypothetical protein
VNDANYLPKSENDMNAPTLHQNLSHIDDHIIRTLLYYDIFNYPLKSDEIFRFLGIDPIKESDFLSSLQFLKQQQIVFQFENFFTLKNSRASIEAEKYLMLAKKQSKLIAKFPFVRGVLASGSLSKGYMDENSDLDFFIITAPKRLWIARTLLVMYKRLFLFNSHKYFCLNYYVDEDHLEIEEKNLFTATELATAIPLYGSKQYENLHLSNTWLKTFFPNYNPRTVSNVPFSKISFSKRILENFSNFIFGDRIEKYFQQKTLSRWKRLYQNRYSATDFQVAFKSKSYASKNHDRNYQRKIMDLYEEKLQLTGMNAKPPLDGKSEYVSSFSKEKSFLNSNASI